MYIREESMCMKLLRILKNQRKNSGYFFAFIVVALILWNTNLLFQNLSKEQRTKMELWAMAQEEYIENQSFSNLTFEVLQRSGINPMIQVDQNDKILEIRNVNWDEKKQDSTALYKILAQIKKENDPIIIQYKDETGALMINQKLYYGNSEVLKKLQYYPLALLLIIFLFGTVLYFVFKTAKIAEQNRLWAAMAKETAHQIGTPLSSLLGWIAILKMEKVDDKYVEEIEKDVHRLNTIANRFSKIGSRPELKRKNIVEVTKQAFDYLESRSSKQILFSFSSQENEIFTKLNAELFGWVIENLIKNAIDAMLGKGELVVRIENSEKKVKITVSDTGKGMPKKLFKQIFKPGFTTKKRGWGLGLSLSKRIVEDYHKGEIVVEKSEIGKGTTFQVLLDSV